MQVIYILYQLQLAQAQAKQEVFFSAPENQLLFHQFPLKSDGHPTSKVESMDPNRHDWLQPVGKG